MRRNPEAYIQPFTVKMTHCKILGIKSHTFQNADWLHCLRAASGSLQCRLKHRIYPPWLAGLLHGLRRPDRYIQV